MQPPNSIPAAPTPEQPISPTQPEVQNTPATELQPATTESQPSTPSNAEPAAAPSTALPSTPAIDPAQNSMPSSSTPTTNLPAADSDLIEKHWVDQAEHIIEADKNDPQKEEADEENLSNQYLKQRFGFDIDKGE